MLKTSIYFFNNKHYQLVGVYLAYISDSVFANCSGKSVFELENVSFFFSRITELLSFLHDFPSSFRYCFP